MPLISSFNGNFGPIGRGTLRFNDATGGNTVTEVSNYNGTGQTWKVHQFTSSGTFTILSGSFDFSLLLLGGGGAGNPNAGWGGGGAGGLITTTKLIAPGSHTITVGSLSQNSTAFDLTALAGGAGGPNSGGCGGGGNGANKGNRSVSGGSATQPSSIWGGTGFAGANAENDTGTETANGAGGGGTGGTPTYIRNNRASSPGGTAATSTITGSSVSYGQGGAGGYGEGGYMSGQNGNAERSGSGIIIIAYRIR